MKGALLYSTELVQGSLVCVHVCLYVWSSAIVTLVQLQVTTTTI